MRAIPEHDHDSSLRRAWATFRDAVRGTAYDLTQVSIRRGVVLLAVPMVLEMSMESLFAVVDIFWVSKLGSDAVALVGITETMLSLVYAVGLGLSAGATAMVARRTGEKDSDGAARAALQAIIAGAAIALAMGVFGVVFAPDLLAAMGGSSAAAKHGTGYTAVMLGGNITIVMLFVVNAIFRGVGDAAIAMRTLWLANILNMILGPCLIYGVGPFPAMGVEGAAVGTTLGRGIGVVYQMVALGSPRSRVGLGRRHLALDLSVMRPILRLSGVASLQTLVETASWLGLVRILASFGSSALAGYTIAIRVVIFALLPSWGMANAAATLVGQNLGADRPERAHRSVMMTALYNVVFLGLVSVAFVGLPGAIVRLFTDDAAVVAVGTECLRIVAIGFLFYAYGMVVVQAFNGAGDTTTPMLINVLCFWVLKIPLAYALARGAGMGPRGVFVAITAAYSVQAVVAGLLFRRGRWKTTHV